MKVAPFLPEGEQSESGPDVDLVLDLLLQRAGLDAAGSLQMT